MHDKDTRMADARRAERRELAGTVVVDLAAQRLQGAGENLSADGVLLLAAGSLRVTVHVEGEADARTGELVRVTPVGGGRMGLAVRFDAATRG